MGRYFARRLIASVFVVWGVVTITFLIVRVVPGDPASMMLGVTAEPAAVARLRHSLGLDKPLPVQYVTFLGDAAQGDFGNSIYQDRPSVGLFLAKLPATIQLAAAALILSVAVALPLGLYSALRANSVGDTVASAFTLTAQSMPSFWVGLMGILVFSQTLQWLPTFGRGTWQQMVLPVVTLALPMMAVTARLVRAGVLESIGEDYVRTARAKGLDERVVLFGHVLKNMLIPVVTVVGLQFGNLLAGAVIVETVFAWPGVGQLTIDAIMRRDYPVVATAVFFISFMFIAVNLIVDLTYAYLDPKIRYA